MRWCIVLYVLRKYIAAFNNLNEGVIMLHNGIGGRWTLGVVVLVPVITYNEVGGSTTVIGSILAAIFSVFAGTFDIFQIIVISI